MFQRLRESLQARIEDQYAVEEPRRSRRERRPKVESLEGRFLCDSGADVFENIGGGISQIEFGGGA